MGGRAKHAEAAGAPSSGTDPAHELGQDGRTALQRRLNAYAGVLLAINFVYWPFFYLIWSQDPGVGPERALAHVFQPGCFALCLVYLTFLGLCRARVWSVHQLALLDVCLMMAVGACFATIVRNHPSPVVSVLEGCLAFSSVLAIRALLVPSTARRSVVAGTVLAGPMGVMLALSQDVFANLSVAYATLLWVFCNWSLIAVAFSAFASSVLYGLRREVREAKRFGQYTLLEKLGQGGMGVVYRAQHAMLRRPTALKLLRAERTQSGLGRFEREVQLMAELTHPNCVTVHDYGRTEDGVLYYAMEFLDGLDMQALVDLSGPQPAARVINLLMQAAGALGEAHSRGLIHRDVKPANLFVCRQHGVADMVKVLDFGVVKQLQANAAESMVTREHVLIGTPLYMSPEAINHPGRVDARSDLYSLGAVGYMLLAGRPVFEAATLVEICAHHLHSIPVPPSLRAEGVPRDLELVILRCLEKSPGARFASAEQLSLSLAACADAGSWNAASARAWWSERQTLVQARRADSVSGVQGPLGLQQTIAIEAHDRTGERRLAETVAD